MARPCKSDSERRDERLEVREAADWMQLLDAAASAAGEGRSEYVRRAVEARMKRDGFDARKLVSRNG